jgi:hypothetical protein
MEKIDKDFRTLRGEHTPKHLKGTRGNKVIKPIYENLNELPDLKRKRKRSIKARSEKLFDDALNKVSSPSKKPRNNYGDDNSFDKPFVTVEQTDTPQQTVEPFEPSTSPNESKGRIKSPAEGLSLKNDEQ